MPIAEVTRELLVRDLDTWTATALHQARRATFAQAWGGPADIGLAAAALRVFDQFTHRLPGRQPAVVLVAGTQSRLLAFATSSAKSLEAFKNCLWAVDEYAGVRYRDPGDPEGHLMDISLRPDPGPLRRELLAHLDAAGGCRVTELRHF